mmetsp:Transcript_17646/g.26136  ORF Transcript_17646/g.26136 Transcript_17646/m.26136 type:complete len:81 (-) Transcript_17646:254-496(-)
MKMIFTRTVFRLKRSTLSNLKRFYNSNPKEGLVFWRYDDTLPKVITLTLNNPNKLNALTVRMGNEFTDRINEIHEEYKKV